MIDDRINKALSELEANLSKVSSASKQVEETVGSYKALTTVTTNYVNSLSKINENLKSVLNLVGKDYEQKVKDFENDSQEIVNSCNSAISSINNAAEEIKENVAGSIDELKKKMNYTIIANIVILVVMIFLFFLSK